MRTSSSRIKCSIESSTVISSPKPKFESSQLVGLHRHRHKRQSNRWAAIHLNSAKRAACPDWFAFGLASASGVSQMIVILPVKRSSQPCVNQVEVCNGAGTEPDIVLIDRTDAIGSQRGRSLSGRQGLPQMRWGHLSVKRVWLEDTKRSAARQLVNRQSGSDLGATTDTDIRSKVWPKSTDDPLVMKGPAASCVTSSSQARETDLQPIMRTS